MGSDRFYPEEASVRTGGGARPVGGEHPLTNAEFRRFVKATGPLTVAERPPDPRDFPGAAPGDLVPGRRPSVRPRDRGRSTTGPAGGTGFRGADWRHAEGRGSTLHGRDRQRMGVDHDRLAGRR